MGQKNQFEGHTIEIKTASGKEVLLIDGKPQALYESEDGYILHSMAYLPPDKSLMSAAKKCISEGGL